MINLYRVFEDGTASILSVQEMNFQELTRQKNVRELNPEKGGISNFELERLLGRDKRAGTPGQSHEELMPFHWQGVPELPRYASDIPSSELDIHSAHESRMQRDNVVGTFCDLPIVTLDKFSMEVDEARDLSNRLANSSGTSVSPEILPGEERCDDGIIRRVTTAEALGYDVYHNQEQIEAGQKRVSIAEAVQASKDGALIFWRPNRHVGKGEYALAEID